MLCLLIPSAAFAEDDYDTVTIQKGDTVKFIYKLWGLPYDSYVDRIKTLNPDADLDNVHPGDLLFLPTTEKNLKTNV